MSDDPERERLARFEGIEPDRDFADDEHIPLTEWRGAAVCMTPEGCVSVLFPRAGIAFECSPDDAYVIARTLGQAIHALAEDPRYVFMINFEKRSTPDDPDA
jgi:hypothetical protein